MNLQDDSLHHLIERITSGEPVIWSDEIARYPEDQAYIEQLEALEKIYAVLNTSIVSTPTNTNTNKLHQFNWGHLQVIEPIAEGNFGQVFRAFDPLLNREVALKLLKVEQMSVTKSRNFMAEARSLAKVRNRHVLAIHGASMHEGRVGFWADLLTGDTLADTAVDYSSEPQLLVVTEAVTDALAAVHQAGLIHGDVKLSNVMSQDNDQIILMDFGAGGEVDMAAAATGSPILMAPELFNNQAKTAASDIYAMGVMLFKLATGQYPVKADNVLAVMQAHKNQHYESLHTLRPDLSKSIVKMINQMLSIEPAQRPDSATIKAELTAIKLAPQRRAKRMVIAGLFGVLAVATLVSSWGFFQANEARVLAETEQRKAEIEQQKATAVSDFLKQMLGSPNDFGEGQDMKVVKLLDYSAENAAKNLQDQPAVLAVIESALGSSYSSLALFEKSLLHINNALGLNSELYGVDDQSTLNVMRNKAYVLYTMKDHAQSQELSERIIELTASNKQADKANFLFAYNRLANIANEQGEYAKALSYLNNDRAKVIPPEMAETNQSAFLLSSKSTAYFNLGDYETAESYARKSLEWNLAWLETERNQHKVGNLIPFRNQLANALNIQGKMQEAETHYRLSLAQAESYYGKDQVGYITPLTNLGVSLYEQGKFQQALEVSQEAYDLNIQYYGRLHSKSIKASNSLANALVSLGRLDEGEQMMRTNLIDAIELAGAESKDALMLEYNLAELLNIQGKYQEGAQLSQENYQRMQKALTDKHPFTPLALSNLAVSLTGLQQYDAAKQAHDSAVSGVEQLVGDQHPFYLVVLWNRVKHYHQLNQRNPGIGELKRLLVSQAEVLGAAHADTQRAQKLLDEWL